MTARMPSHRRAAAALVLIGGLAAATMGCSPQGVDVPPGADARMPCDPADIAVEDLAALGAPGCDLVGSTLLFPDPTLQFPYDGPGFTISSVGAAFAFQDGEGRQVYVDNWGVPGVAAATLTRDDELVDLWASTLEARALEIQLLRLGDVTGLDRALTRG